MRKRRDVSAWLMFDKCEISMATHILIIGNDRSMEIVDHKIPYFFYRKVKYFSKSAHPYPVAYCVGDTEYFHAMDEYREMGLSSDQVLSRQQTYGLCEHTVDIPSLLGYLADEMMGIFFILQYITCVIYLLEGFIFFGVALIGTSMLSTIINYFLLRSGYLKIKELAEHKTMVQVIRDKKLIELDSSQLVPGDIFVPAGVIPCDCILVDGELYLNEASLTGESVPIAKSPAINIASTKLPSCCLYEGSNVL
jgi:magnesium-transporting ATPase (P-type)